MEREKLIGLEYSLINYELVCLKKDDAKNDTILKRSHINVYIHISIHIPYILSDS